MSAHESLIAHSIHYGVLALGLVGLAYLLTPHLLHPPERELATEPRDEHEQRVLLLRGEIAAGTLGREVPGMAPYATGTSVSNARVAGDRAVVLVLPIALASSAAAAGVHAAVGPAHFRESTLFGLFFAGSALLQMLWAGAALVGVSRPLLAAGLVLNSGCAVLWGVTRAIGLPFGLLPTPEAVGPWDLACVGWELVAVVTCSWLLRQRRSLPRAPAFHAWETRAQVWAVGSAVLLGILSVSGAGS